VRRNRKCYLLIVPNLKVQVYLAEWEETLNEKNGKYRVLAGFKPALIRALVGKAKHPGAVNGLRPTKIRPSSTFPCKSFGTAGSQLEILESF
jgi:hypothetical protein